MSLLLNGNVDNRDEMIRSLREEVQRLRDELADKQRDMREASAAVARLREVLSPLYSGLRVIFGELDAIAAEPVSSAVDPHTSKVWEAWKQKLPGYPAKFIDALLTHGEMSGSQLRVVMQCATNTVYNVASQLNKLGLLGTAPKGRYRLKEL